MGLRVGAAMGGCPPLGDEYIREILSAPAQLYASEYNNFRSWNLPRECKGRRQKGRGNNLNQMDEGPD